MSGRFFQESLFFSFRNPACVKRTREIPRRSDDVTGGAFNSFSTNRRRDRGSTIQWTTRRFVGVVFSTISCRSDAAPCHSLNRVRQRELARFCQVSAGLTNFSRFFSLLGPIRERERVERRKEFDLALPTSSTFPLFLFDFSLLFHSDLFLHFFFVVSIPEYCSSLADI